VNNGIARRSWARNKGAMVTLKREMERTPGLIVTLPFIADDIVIEEALGKST
jgi:urocanate hydratase